MEKKTQVNFGDAPKVDDLQLYITEQGRILPRRVTKLSAKQHRKVTKEIKRTRILGLLPFINKK